MARLTLPAAFCAVHGISKRDVCPRKLRSINCCLASAGQESNGKAPMLRLGADMEIDFGGIGKEYAADRAVAAVADLGGEHGLVNLGGDVRVIGPHADGSPWRIAVQDPRGKPGETIAYLNVPHGAMATSGDYERYFEHDGRRYSHLLDPRTGWPVEHWRSVSVVAPLAVAAGACATVAMLKPVEDALAFLDAQGVRYLAIDAQGKRYSR